MMFTEWYIMVIWCWYILPTQRVKANLDVIFVFHIMPSARANVNANITALSLNDFHAVLQRIVFEQAQRDAITEMSGRLNIAMLSLLSADQISCMGKQIENQS